MIQTQVTNVKLTELFFLDELEAYSTALVNRTWVTELTKVSIRDVITIHTHTVDVLPYAETTFYFHIHMAHNCRM